jgi:hypothetical protein
LCALKSFDFVIATVLLTVLCGSFFVLDLSSAMVRAAWLRALKSFD